MIEVYHSKTNVFRIFNSTGPIGSINVSPVGIASINDSNVDTNEFFRLAITPSSTSTKLQVFRYKNSNIDFSSSIATIGYWENETFQSEPAGVKVILQLSNCSGIFRSGTGGVSDWNAAIGLGQAGVPVDSTLTRSDLGFTYYGNYTSFAASAGTSGYGVFLHYPSIELQMNYGQYGDIAAKTGQTLSFVDYDIDGNFTTYVLTYLDLENIVDDLNRPYSDPDFELTGVSYKLAIKTSVPILTTGTLTISPPNGSGTIDAAVYKNKSGSIVFSMSRSLNTNIRNIELHKNGSLMTQLPSYIGDTPLTALLPIQTTNLIKGDAVSVKYRPLYFDSRGPDVLDSSREITYVNGHMYHISNLQIYIDGTDRTTSIANSSKPYVYVDSGGTAQIDISVDIDHETFPYEAYPSNLERVYPIISNTYLMAIPKIHYPRRFEKIPPVGSPLTYPNCNQALYAILKAKYGVSSFTDTNVHGGTTISLSGESFTVTVTEGGDYHIYLLVEDEYGQGSAWCLTNMSKYYRIPFVN
jgi:hypothetical protein